MNQFWVHKMCSDSKVIFTSKTRMSCQLLRVTIPWSWGGGSGGKRGGGTVQIISKPNISPSPPHRCGLAAIFSTKEKEQWNVNASTLCTILVFFRFWAVENVGEKTDITQIFLLFCYEVWCCEFRATMAAKRMRRRKRGQHGTNSPLPSSRYGDSLYFA